MAERSIVEKGKGKPSVGGQRKRVSEDEARRERLVSGLHVQPSQKTKKNQERKEEADSIGKLNGKGCE